jgi:hypothetical protein
MSTPEELATAAALISGQAAATVGTPADAGVKIMPLGFIIHIPDLRNGDLANIQQAAPKASIPSAYKWAHISGLMHTQAVDAVEYIIRGTYAQLMSDAGNDVTPAAKNDVRKRAIVLGAVRAGAIAAYKLDEGLMNKQECSTSGYRTASGQVFADNKSSTTGGKYTIASSMAALEAVEVEVISMLIYLGMAVPVLQGASLVSTGHHYLPTTKNIFAGMKRQALGLVKDAATAWVEAMGETFDDMAFHKSCHPISPPVKRRWAKDPSIAARLLASGHGAASVRLPATPSDAAIGKTCVALARAAQATIFNMGHNLTIVTGPNLIIKLEQANEGAEEREAIINIQNWAMTHAHTFAFCAGIVQQIHEAAGTGRNTLLAAYSVKKLMADHATDVATGIAYSRASAAATRRTLEDGTFRAINLTV